MRVTIARYSGKAVERASPRKGRQAKHSLCLIWLTDVMVLSDRRVSMRRGPKQRGVEMRPRAKDQRTYRKITGSRFIVVDTREFTTAR